MMRKIVLSLCLLAACCASYAAEPLPTAEEILPKFLARLQWEREHKVEDQWGYTLRTVKQELDKNGAAKETTELLYEAELVDDKPFPRLKQKNGKAPDEKDLKQEAEREKKFRKRNATAAQHSNPSDEDGGQLNEEMLSRYQFHVVGKEPVNGRDAYVITFLPKVGVKLPEKNMTDKIFNRLEGKAWIDAKTYALSRAEFALTEPTTFKAGLGALRQLEASIIFVAVDADTFLPQSMKFSAEARVLFSTKNIRQTAVYSDFHRFSESAASGKP